VLSITQRVAVVLLFYLQVRYYFTSKVREAQTGKGNRLLRTGMEAFYLCISTLDQRPRDRWFESIWLRAVT